MPNQDEIDAIRRVQNKKDPELGAIVSMINVALATGGNIVAELVRTAQSNPIIGIFVVYLLVDVAVDKGLLHGDSALAIKGIILASAGLELTSEIITALSDLIPSAGAKATPTLLTPTATTIVNTNERVDPASAAELGRK